MARSTRQISDRSRRLKENPPTYIPMHVATVFTTMVPLPPEQGGRPPDEVFQLSKNDPKWYIWHPIRERLEFRFDGNGTPGPLTYHTAGRPGRTGPPIGGMAIGVKTHSVAQVPDARDIWPERSELLDGLMSTETPVRPEAQAQVLVPWGDIYGSGVFDKKDGVEVVFDPARVPGVPRTVVPNVALFVEAERVEIASYSMDTGEKLDSILFNLSADAEIWVSNGDPSDTAIDLQKLSDEIARENRENEEKLFRDNVGKELDDVLHVQPHAVDLSKFAARIMTGGAGSGIIRPNVLDNQFVRSSKFDIDFELFYTITRHAHLESDGRGRPVPMKADGLPFAGPNCLVKQVECPDALRLKSNDA